MRAPCCAWGARRVHPDPPRDPAGRRWGVATIQAPNQTVKAALGDRHLSMLRDLLGPHVGKAIEVRVALNPHAPAPRLTLADSPQPSTPNSQPPAWICAERWVELPALLRAALVGSLWSMGAVRGRDAFVTRLLETRHRREVEGLVKVVGEKQSDE